MDEGEEAGMELWSQACMSMDGDGVWILLFKRGPEAIHI
jgi:hypothetical protein